MLLWRGHEVAPNWVIDKRSKKQNKKKKTKTKAKQSLNFSVIIGLPDILCVH